MGSRVSEPYPAGTRVHHRGAIYSVGQAPEHPEGGLRGGWGIVISSVKQGDGTYEYEVRADRSVAGNPVTGWPMRWWGSHHINRVLRLVP